MILQKQRVVSNKIGDCFPACIATLLELPLEVLPNDHSDSWWKVWDCFLAQFGLSLTYDSSEGPIWQDYPWIATVKSKNFESGSHAIVMMGHCVFFDPSTKKTYKKGESLLGKNIVQGGYRINVADFTVLHKLEEYRNKIA